MLGPLLLGNYMGTSSTQEFTQAEVVHAVYFYPYLSVFFAEYFEGFPLRFETKGNPSVGTMEIFSNSSWQTLCTSQWDDADKNSVCMAMGYYNNGVYANETWYAERGNASMSTHYNCTIPTTCQNNVVKKQQVCEGNYELHSCNIHMISKDGNLIDLLTLQR